MLNRCVSTNLSKAAARKRTREKQRNEALEIYIDQHVYHF